MTLACFEVGDRYKWPTEPAVNATRSMVNIHINDLMEREMQRGGGGEERTRRKVLSAPWPEHE